MKAINAYPDRFRGFGRVPLKMSLEETVQWIEEKVKGVGFLGLGEFTLTPGEASGLEVVFEASAHLGSLPLWIHTFHPLGLEDIRVINDLSRRFPGVPVILGHLGGTNWMQAIYLARDNTELYLDLSAAFTIFAPTMAIKELPERTLFSSDAPYGDPYLVKKMLERITPDKFVRERVLGDNIAELLNL
ncbi:MAG TPA: amidohydrolase family protein [Syntrophomonadaceae bacterium]|nr:amidohydrolase family protein [Syntrophomonadaceae bacterium]